MTTVRIKLPALLCLSLQGPCRAIRTWWLRQVEAHYLMCAAVEAQRVQEAQQNLAYYQKQAALTRSLRGQ